MSSAIEVVLVVAVLLRVERTQLMSSGFIMCTTCLIDRKEYKVAGDTMNMRHLRLQWVYHDLQLACLGDQHTDNPVLQCSLVWSGPQLSPRVCFGMVDSILSSSDNLPRNSHIFQVFQSMLLGGRCSSAKA